MSSEYLASQRLFSVSGFGLLVIACATAAVADTVGLKQMHLDGPYVLYGIMVPGNGIALLISLGILIRFRTDTALFVAALVAFVFNVVSSGFVGLLVLGHWLFINFPGPE